VFEEILRPAHDLLSRQYAYAAWKGKEWCIAGGAVRDTLLGRLPKDIDVFIFNCNYENASLDSIPVEALRGLVHPGTISRRPFYSEEVQCDGDPVTLQLMYTPEKDIKSLLNSFDWNICQVAIEPDGTLHDPVGIIDLVEKEKLLRLHKVTNPFSNMRRGYRFSERYGMRISTWDLVTLAKAMILATVKKQALNEEKIKILMETPYPGARMTEENFRVMRETLEREPMDQVFATDRFTEDFGQVARGFTTPLEDTYT
jgi:hypothetical protein